MPWCSKKWCQSLSWGILLFCLIPGSKHAKTVTRVPQRNKPSRSHKPYMDTKRGPSHCHRTWCAWAITSRRQEEGVYRNIQQNSVAPLGVTGKESKGISYVQWQSIPSGEGDNMSRPCNYRSEDLSQQLPICFCRTAPHMIPQRLHVVSEAWES